MANRWRVPDGAPGSRLGYPELSAGPGRAILDNDELDGCPLIAARRDSLFHRLALVEYDQELAGALEQRLGTRGLGSARTRVFAAGANDSEVLFAAMEFLAGRAQADRTGGRDGSGLSLSPSAAARSTRSSGRGCLPGDQLAPNLLHRCRRDRRYRVLALLHRLPSPCDGIRTNRPPNDGGAAGTAFPRLG
jgi:hypothetical protein